MEKRSFSLAVLASVLASSLAPSDGFSQGVPDTDDMTIRSIDPSTADSVLFCEELSAREDFRDRPAKDRPEARRVFRFVTSKEGLENENTVTAICAYDISQQIKKIIGLEVFEVAPEEGNFFWRYRDQPIDGISDIMEQYAAPDFRGSKPTQMSQDEEGSKPEEMNEPEETPQKRFKDIVFQAREALKRGDFYREITPQAAIIYPPAEAAAQAEPPHKKPTGRKDRKGHSKK